jgi:hypothetical protein
LLYLSGWVSGVGSGNGEDFRFFQEKPRIGLEKVIKCLSLLKRKFKNQPGSNSTNFPAKKASFKVSSFGPL